MTGPGQHRTEEAADRTGSDDGDRLESMFHRWVLLGVRPMFILAAVRRLDRKTIDTEH
jgi:hypothetical protein